jgi:hypothetical protein
VGATRLYGVEDVKASRPRPEETAAVVVSGYNCEEERRIATLLQVLRLTRSTSSGQGPRRHYNDRGIHAS